MDSILENLSHETEPKRTEEYRGGGAAQRKLTIRPPAGRIICLKPAPTAPRRRTWTPILRNSPATGRPPPGPQLFGPPPKARAKPTLQRTTPRAPDAGPLSVDPRAPRAHVAARPTSEAPPTAEETLAALGAPGDDEAPPTAPPTAEEAMEALGVPRYVRDALAAADGRGGYGGRPRRGAAARAEEAAAERLRQHLGSRRSSSWSRATRTSLLGKTAASSSATRRGSAPSSCSRYFTVKTGTATFPSFARQLNYYGFARAKTGATSPTCTRVGRSRTSRRWPARTSRRGRSPRRRRPSRSFLWRSTAASSRSDVLREEVRSCASALAQAEAALPIHTAGSARATARSAIFLADSATSNDVCAFVGSTTARRTPTGRSRAIYCFRPSAGMMGSRSGSTRSARCLVPRSTASARATCTTCWLRSSGAGR